MLTSGKRKLLLTTIHFFYWDFLVWSRAVWKPLSFHSTGNASETRWTLLKHDEIRFHQHIWLPIINNSFHFIVHTSWVHGNRHHLISPHEEGRGKNVAPLWPRQRSKKNLPWWMLPIAVESKQEQPGLELSRLIEQDKEMTELSLRAGQVQTRGHVVWLTDIMRQDKHKKINA